MPRRALLDLFDSRKKCNSIKLYAQCVYTMGERDELMPEGVNFVKVEVDYEDLTLSISHETLPRDKTLRVVKKNLVERCLEMSTESAKGKDDCKTYREQFGKCFKLGACEDTTDSTKVVELLPYHTSKSRDEMFNLQEGVDRDDIHHVDGESVAAASSAPFLEAGRKGPGALCVTDCIDECPVQ